MMIWPSYIAQPFTDVDLNTADAASYYGAYNSLLNLLFPASQGFSVVPTPQPGHDKTLLFVVNKFRHPVVFLDVRPPLPTSSTGASAACIQEAIADMSRALYKVPCKVKGISAFGPRFIVYEYEYDAAANELDYRAGAPAMVEGGEEERDIRTSEGAQRLKELARCIGGIALDA